MKIAIVTLTASPNYGNFLQNFALQEVLNGYGCKTETIRNYYHSSLFVRHRPLKKKISILLNYRGDGKKEIKRKKAEEFYKKHITYSDFIYSGTEELPKSYDAYIVGSDQTWNPSFGVMTSLELLHNIPNEKRYSYSASFGVDNLNSVSEEKLSDMQENFTKFSRLSVRENSGKEILRKLGIDNVEVNLDPTMLLTSEKWKTVLIKPKRVFPERFLAVYMLGEITPKYKKIISELSKKYNTEIVNILDDSNGITNSFEFLWTIAHSQCVCTDSFHATVFSVLFHRDFFVFDRKDSFENQNSRFETLIEKTGIGKLNLVSESCQIPNFDVNWELVDKAIEEERLKSNLYFKKIFEKLKRESINEDRKNT